MTGVNRNQVWGRVFLDELARCGVREICISPGSRSTPLVLAAVEDQRFRTSLHLDERSAAYFALGVGKASGIPAGVVTTSGTAAANLMPAVVEANRSEAPLLLLTADRPRGVRELDANQAVDQVHFFGRQVRAFHDLPAPRVEDVALRRLRAQACRAFGDSTGLPPGPVHVNVPLGKPLEPTPVAGDVPEGFEERFPLAARGRPDGEPYTRTSASDGRPDAGVVRGLVERLEAAHRPLLVAGPTARPEAGAAVRRLARAARVPLLADALSGARFVASAEGPVLARYDLYLRHPEVRRRLRPDLVLRVGRPPTSTAVARLLEESPEAEQVIIDPAGIWKDQAVTAAEYLRARPDPLLEEVRQTIEGEGFGVRSPERRRWSETWGAAESAARRSVRRAFARDPFEGLVLHEVSAAVPAGGLLFVSSSMPVRDLEAFGAVREVPLRVLGNRGASGIDGIVSSSLGVAAATGAPVVCVLGDLALFHDLNGFFAARRPGLRVVFVVINNDGGGIFHLLPIREHEPAFTPWFATPHGLDFSPAAAFHGIEHRRVPLSGERAPGSGGGAGAVFLPALRAAVRDGLRAEGPRILEVTTDREENRERRMAAVKEAGEAALAAL